MPKSKKSPRPKKVSARKPARKTAARTAIKNGPVPPYGTAIREAIARGDVQEMKRVAASTRKWLTDVSNALERLESSLK